MLAKLNCLRRRKPGRRGWLAAEVLESRQLLAVITVNSIGDADGADGGITLSLRQAIEISNGTLAISALSMSQAGLVSGALSTPNTIDFAIASGSPGPFVIEPATALPSITSPVVIDGYSEAGAQANTNGPGLGKNTVIEIELNGSAAPGASGLHIQAGGTTVEGLAIDGFTAGLSSSSGAGAGIYIDAQTGDRIVGNFLGTNATGTFADPNGIGILDENVSLDGSSRPPSSNTIGGTAPADGNVISGDNFEGIGLAGTGAFGSSGPSYPVHDLVEGNFIGTDVTGSKSLFSGTDVFQEGIYDSGGGSTIGGTAPGAGNLISGNDYNGLRIYGYVYSTGRNGTSYVYSADLVEGNQFGTDVTGKLSLPNEIGIEDDGGVSTIGGTASGAGNLISGNSGDGLKINGGAGVSVVVGLAASTSASDLVQGNFIGTDASGAISLPNGGNGILFTNESGNSTVGGSASGAANVIAFNKGSGVAIKLAGPYSSLPTFQISQNSIYANGDQGIVGSFATTPTLLSVTPSGSGSLITGAINDNPIEPVLPYTIEFFANTTPDPSGAGQGQTYLGSISVTTDTVAHASFSFSTPVNLLGKYVSATAYGINGGTSNFSNDVLGYTVGTTTTLTGPGVAQFGQTFTLTAIVAPTANEVPTGQVTFLANGASIGTATLNASGVATLNTTILQPGSYAIQAKYLGDGTNSPSQSATTGLNILKYASTTTLTGPSGTTLIGQPVTFTATVPVGEPGFATGLVQFSADGIILGTSPLSPSGIATFATSSLGSGNHVILAAYLGDLLNAPSQSSPITVTISATSSTTSLALLGPNRVATQGQPITFTTSVTSPGSIPSGLVEFLEDGVGLGSTTVGITGIATFVTDQLMPGPHVITAVYLGDASHPAAISNAIAVEVNNVTAFGGPAVTSDVLTGPRAITVTFNRGLLMGPAQSLANYTIMGPRRQVITIISAVYNPANASVTLTTDQTLDPKKTYVLTINGQKGERVVDVFGIALNGKTKGKPGHNYSGNVVVKKAQVVKVTHPSTTPKPKAVKTSAVPKAKR